SRVTFCPFAFAHPLGWRQCRAGNDPVASETAREGTFEPRKMGTSGAVIDSSATGVAEGFRIASKVLATPMVVALVGLLPALAFEDWLFANLAAPGIELLEAIFGAKRLVMIVGRDCQLAAAVFVAAEVPKLSVTHSINVLLQPELPRRATHSDY